MAENGIKSSIFHTRLVCYALELLVLVQAHQPEEKRRSFLKFYASVTYETMANVCHDVSLTNFDCHKPVGSDYTKYVVKCILKFVRTELTLAVTNGYLSGRGAARVAE